MQTFVYFGHTKHMAENPIQLCMGEVGYKRSRSASKIDTLRAPFPRRDVRLSAAMADCRAPFISELDETLRSLLRRRASPRSWRPSLVPLPYIAVWGFPPYVLYGQRSAYFQKWTGGGNSTLLSVRFLARVSNVLHFPCLKTPLNRGFHALRVSPCLYFDGA